MKAALHSESIDVQALRVGMFVHLDLGWMAHPFPLSSFRITTAAQVATIRGLGLERVRWSPQQSDADLLDGADPASPGADPLAPDAAGQPGDRTGRPGPEAVTPSSLPPPAFAAAAGRAAAAANDDGPDTIPQALERRAALHVCEQQYAEAANACRHALTLVETKPQEAREQAEALTRALVDKMLDAGDLVVRVLAEGATDRASMHAMNVGLVSLLLGRALGLAPDEMHDLGCGALLHDVGKLELPLRMRWRDSGFTPSELRVYEEHVALGAQQARRMGLSPGAAAIIEQHHEHADGSGFPHRLRCDDIGIAARIVALVNAYDNLCNPRLAAKALTPHEALSQLFAQGRARFDAPIMASFIRMMSVYPPGSTVQLTDDRYAQVVAVNASRPLKPSVLVFDALHPDLPRDEAPLLDLEQAGLGIRRSLKPQQLPPPALEWLAPSPRVAYFFEPAGELETV